MNPQFTYPCSVRKWRMLGICCAHQMRTSPLKLVAARHFSAVRYSCGSRAFPGCGRELWCTVVYYSLLHTLNGRGTLWTTLHVLATLAFTSPLYVSLPSGVSYSSKRSYDMHLQSGCRTLKFRNQRARMRFLIMQYSSILGECHLLVVSYTLRKKINLKGEIRPGPQVIGLLKCLQLMA